VGSSYSERIREEGKYGERDTQGVEYLKKRK
jgi:hypothetical protein